jgi:hypothetical protein
MSERWEPHTCQGCGGRFEIGYRPYEAERRGPVEAAATCPHCGRSKTVGLPRGFEAAFLVRAADDEDNEEGGGG